MHSLQKYVGPFQINESLQLQTPCQFQCFQKIIFNEVFVNIVMLSIAGAILSLVEE